MNRSLVITMVLLGVMMGFACAPKAQDVPPPVPIAPAPELLAAAQDSDGFAPLFKEGLSNATMEAGGWKFADGTLESLGKGDIWTKDRYGDFILDLEFKCAEDTNSGVFIRCADMDDWLHTAIEVQVLQPNDKYPNNKWHCGAIFDVLAPYKQMVKQPGEWNQYTIIAKDNLIHVLLNGELVIGMNLNQWTEPHKNPDGTKNKFKYPYKDLVREGHIGMQYHGQPVAFRNLRIKQL